MNPQRRQEIEQWIEEIRAELTMISETKVMPGINPPDREDRLLDELDTLEFELGKDHFWPDSS